MESTRTSQLTEPSVEPFDQDALDLTYDDAAETERRRVVPEVVVDDGAGAGDPGASLLEEARRLVVKQRWRAAERMALSASRLRNDADSHAVATLAAAHRRMGSGPRLARLIEIAEDVDAADDERATAWSALAAVALVEHRFETADAQARNAIDFDAGQPAAWWVMAASFAGLGWFEESEECVKRAEKLGATIEVANASEADLVDPDDVVLYDQAADERERSEPMPGEDDRIADPISALGPWLVGRATNRWAMTRSPVLGVLLIGVFLASLLGVALAITVPFVTREFRVHQLEGATRDRADAAWRDATSLRLAGAGAVLVCVSLWVAALSIAA